MVNQERTQLFLPFHLGDPAGILFFGHVFTLSHQVFEQFVMDRLNCTWNEWFQNPNWIVPIRKTESEFYSPLHVGEWCEIHLAISAVNRSSFTCEITFSQSVLCCSVRTVHVFCDRQSRQAMPIPDSLRLILNMHLMQNQLS